MNYKLNKIPNRTKKTRDIGLTMVMDKGLSVREAEDLVYSSSDYIDIIKLGFGTAIISKNIKKKIQLYQKNNIKVHVGGTLFEAFIIRNMFDDYIKFVEELNLNTIEVSDGSIDLNHKMKCEYISDLSKKFTVFSEVGYKKSNRILAPSKWIKLMKQELDAGSWKVIAEARESGTVGVFRKDGEIRSDLIEEILSKIPNEKILWEAPKKDQQVWFIKLMGANVNLGNIDPRSVIPLECLRLGLRGDTFHQFIK
ncbi:MAG: phosphosulfolactate synthase [Bacteroidota bacterium]|nr:phosphosulfolactate synthase [Bacteroidota bacterium]